MRYTLALFACALILSACSPARPPAGETGAESAQGMSVASSSESVMKLTEVSSTPTSTDGTCLSEIGKTASEHLVQRCIMVSPATHPPCNAANACEMIQDEIDRSCAMYGPEEKKPAECTA